MYNHVIVTEKSGDRKLTAHKNVSATWVPQQSCHDDCPLRKNGCYAETNKSGIHTHRLNKAAKATKMSEARLRVLLAKEEAHGIRHKLTGTRKLRVHVVGDCATAETAGIVGSAMVDYEAMHGQPAWTYTHSWRRFKESKWKGANVLASCERPEQVALAKKQGYAAVLIVPNHPTNKVYTYKGVNVLPCPAQFKGKDGTRTVTCESCNICQRPEMLKAKGLTVGFQPDNKLETKKIYRLIGAD